jgi:hypothetical protein
MGGGKRPLGRRGFVMGAGLAAAAVATVSQAARASQASAAETAGARPAGTVHFQPDGGISQAHLVDQLAGNGQSIDGLAFITSAPAGNLELLGRGGAGTFVKLNYLDGSGTERTGLAVQTATDSPIISIAPEANGAASLDLENNDLTGVITVVPSPDSNAQLSLDGLLAFTPQAQPAVPSSGGVLYVDAADGALKFIGSAGTVTPIAPA